MKILKPRPQIEIRTIRRYFDLFPTELELRGTGKSSAQGPDFQIFAALADEYWLVTLRRLFKTKTPEELGEPYGRFIQIGEDGQEIAVGLYRLKNGL